MNCDHVRERILTGSLDDLSDVEAHLVACPTCRALADAARNNQHQLFTRLEDFMSAPPTQAQLDALLGELPRSRASRPWWVAALVATAALATLAIALRGSLGLGPAAAPPQPPDEVAAFEAIDLSAVSTRGMDRATERQTLASALQRKAQAMMAAETKLQERLQDAPPADQAVTWKRLGDLYVGMAHALRALPAPSELTEAQAPMYAVQIEEKAMVQVRRGVEAYEKGRELALEVGQTELVTDLDTTRDAAVRAFPSERQHAANLEAAFGSRVDAWVAAFEARLDACPATASALVAEGRALLHEIADTRAQGDAFPYRDWLDSLNAIEDRFAASDCPEVDSGG